MIPVERITFSDLDDPEDEPHRDDEGDGVDSGAAASNATADGSEGPLHVQQLAIDPDIGPSLWVHYYKGRTIVIEVGEGEDGHWLLTDYRSGEDSPGSPTVLRLLRAVWG